MMIKELSISNSRDRVEQIVNIDTNALLFKIHSLERQISDFNRVDTIPTWVINIIQRIEQLEQRSFMNCQQSSQSTTNTNNTDIDHDKDNNQSNNKMKTITDLQIQSSLIKEVKVDLLTSEIDRMHSLLALRVTSSELSQVVASLNDTHRKVFDSLDDMAGKIR